MARARPSAAADDGEEQRLRDHDTEHEAIRVAERLQDRQLGGALPDRDRHGVADDQQQGEEHHRSDRENQELDVAHLLHEGSGHGLLGLGAGLVGRVGEFFVDRLADAHRVFGVADAQDVPPDEPLEERRPLLLEVLSLEPELREVVLCGATFVDRLEVELPGSGEGRALDGDAVADLPAESLGEGRSRHAPRPVGQERLPLLLGDLELRVDGPVGVGVDRELGEEVLLVLVDPAEPRGEGHVRDPGDPLDAVAVRQGQGLDQRGPVDDHQAVVACDVDPLVEGAADRDQEPEEEQGDRERAEGEQGPHLLAAQVGQDEGQELHCGASPSTRAPFSR